MPRAMRELSPSCKSAIVSLSQVYIESRERLKWEGDFFQKKNHKVLAFQRIHTWSKLNGKSKFDLNKGM